MRPGARKTGVGVVALSLLAGCPARQESRPTEGASPRRSGELRRLLPAPQETEGWVFPDAPVAYSPETLFEYLDGGATRFIGYGFVSLVQARYVRAGEPDVGVTLDVYDMGSVLGAFGIYSAARTPDVAARGWCVEGYRSGSVATAWKGRFYVHAAADEERPELLDLTEHLVAAVCSRIAGEASPPPLLDVLPREGLVARSERYVAADLLGHSFLPGGVLATYEVEGRKVELFFSDLRSAPAAREALNRLRRHYADRGTPVRDGPAIGEASLRHEDPVLGAGTVVATGRCVVGAHGGLSPEAQELLLERLVARLERLTARPARRGDSGPRP